MRILITDDSKVARMGVKRSLPQHMTEINTIDFAVNGQEAVDQYAVERYDLVFMDLTMPEKDGYEATKEIVAMDPTAYVIVVTADIQNSGVGKALENGARTVIQKPIDTNKLNHALVDFFKTKDQ